jgi:bifunctional non-homologous end joining protein LigD
MTTWPIAPMKATNGRLPRGADWWYEPKWDGHRALVRVHAGKVDAISSTGQPRMDRWRFLARVGEVVTVDNVVLDGEVVAMGEDGRHSFQLVGRPDRPHALVAFDLLVDRGKDIFSMPWRERRDRLEQVMSRTSQFFITPVSDDADSIMKATRDNGFEGVIAKRADSIYLPGRRTTAWIKVKHRYEQEMVIGGYLLGEGNRSTSFGSLLVGVYEQGVLRYVGAVGTGFDDATLSDVWGKLRKLERTECPFDPLPVIVRGKWRARWVKPELVAQVRFAEWTEGGSVRHPVFLGLRTDKDPRRVVREF